jgi:hypothetical protein
MFPHCSKNISGQGQPCSGDEALFDLPLFGLGSTMALANSGIQQRLDISIWRRRCPIDKTASRLCGEWLGTIGSLFSCCAKGCCADTGMIQPTHSVSSSWMLNYAFKVDWPLSWALPAADRTPGQAATVIVLSYRNRNASELRG